MLGLYIESEGRALCKSVMMRNEYAEAWELLRRMFCLLVVCLLNSALRTSDSDFWMRCSENITLTF